MYFKRNSIVVAITAVVFCSFLGLSSLRATSCRLETKVTELDLKIRQKQNENKFFQAVLEKSIAPNSILPYAEKTGMKAPLKEQVKIIYLD